jgi:hypothetical protein
MIGTYIETSGEICAVKNKICSSKGQTLKVADLVINRRCMLLKPSINRAEQLYL